jgi:amino acid transporter
MATLFEAVANHHGVSTGQVRSALAYRRASLDLLVLAAFVVFYVAVANGIVGWMFQSVPSDGPWRRSLATTIAACGAGACGVMLFGLYFATFEMIRIGNTHMSYRTERIPWSQSQSELLVGGIVLFALVAAYRHARDRAETREFQAIEDTV